MTTTGRRTQVQALDELTAQLRLANVLAVIAMTPSALDEVDVKRKGATPAMVARQSRLNRLRAEARAALGIEEADDARSA